MQLATRFLSVLTLLLALFLSSSCGKPGTASASGKLKVVATVGMIADIARNVAGEHAEVEGMIGEGVDPHLYKPTSDDVKLLAGADLVFYNGLLLEGKMTDVLVRVAERGKPVRAISENLAEREGYLIEDGEAHHDPHVWMDVTAWIEAVRVVARTLAETDPAHAADYQANATAYIAKLGELDRYAREVLGSIPEARRILVTAHDAFNYMAKAYGLEVRGIQGISTESEAGLKDIENLINLLVERSIPAVFVESSVSDKNIRALVEGARARGHEVRIGGELFSDAMGEAGTYEGTYIGMIDHNVTTIAHALGGTAPEGGMQGKLKP